MKQEYPAIVIKKILIAQAIGKTLSRWGKLCTYTKDARLNIHNDMVENATRPVAVDRKKYLFDLSHEAEQRATIVYSLMATCKLHNINLYYWFWDVLENMNLFTTSNIGQLLTKNWKKLLDFLWVERWVTPSRYEPVFIDLCELLITHYSTKMSATRLYSPRDKVMVEKSVRIGYNQF